MTNLYRKKDAMDVDHDIYYHHVNRITAEKLHSKADIAAELAVRDERILDLEKELKQAIQNIEDKSIEQLIEVLDK